MQSALFVVRQRVYVSGRAQDDVEAVLDEVSRLSPDGGLVEITGGEPMLQEREVVPLMQRLAGRRIQGAARDQRRAAAGAGSGGVVKIVDVKCPDSGEGDTFSHGKSGERSRRTTKSSLCLSGRVDYEFAREFTQRHDLAERVNAVLFSPAFRKDATGRATARIACSIRRNWRSG